MQHEIAEMKVDEMQMQSKANMQGKDSYLLHYRGTYITPPYSDKMSSETVGVGSQEGESDKETAYDQRHVHSHTDRK